MTLTDLASRKRVSRVLIAAGLALTAFSAEVRAASFDTLYSFPVDAKRGSAPQGSLVRDGTGALYGVTVGGALAKCMGGCGVIYQLKPTGSGPWQQKLLHKFDRFVDGAGPTDGPIMGPDGTLYGTTTFGGSLDGGTVFALTPPAAGGSQWTFETLHEFDAGSTNDKAPYGKLMLGKDGALYGTNSGNGGTSGTIYRLKRTKTGWAYRALYHFTERVGADAGLVEDDKGRLYGAGNQGGANGDGVIFRLSPPAAAGGDWSYKVLYNFNSAENVINPNGTLVLRDGALYGQAFSNPGGGGSVVFRLTLPSTLEVLYRTKAATQGASLGTGLAIDDQGAIYGVNLIDGPGGEGTLFKLLPPKASGGKWSFRLLHAFSGSPDGDHPFCQPLLDEDGNVYVTAGSGGVADKGGVFVYRP